jgi:hypothetical protein
MLAVKIEVNHLPASQPSDVVGAAQTPESLILGGQKVLVVASSLAATKL